MSSNNRINLFVSLTGTPKNGPLCESFDSYSHMNNIVLAMALLLTFGLASCSPGFNEIEYQGQKIKLSKSYSDYDDYKNDPENIHSSETTRVQHLVMNAPIADIFKNRLEAGKAIGQIAFPGYGSSGFRGQQQPDGSVLVGFSVEIPRAGKERYFVFHEQDGLCKLIDDFIYSETPGLLQSVVRRGNELVFSTIEGKEVLVRRYPGDD